MEIAYAAVRAEGRCQRICALRQFIPVLSPSYPFSHLEYSLAACHNKCRRFEGGRLQGLCGWQMVKGACIFALSATSPHACWTEPKAQSSCASPQSFDGRHIHAAWVLAVL